MLSTSSNVRGSMNLNVYMHATTTFPTTMTLIAISVLKSFIATQVPGTHMNAMPDKLMKAHCAKVPLQLPASGQKASMKRCELHGTVHAPS